MDIIKPFTSSKNEQSIPSITTLIYLIFYNNVQFMKNWVL